MISLRSLLDREVASHSNTATPSVPSRSLLSHSSLVSGGDAESNVCGENWLDDYTRGMQYEVYSLPFNVPQSSSLKGMSFSRWGHLSIIILLFLSLTVNCAKQRGLSGSLERSLLDIASVMWGVDVSPTCP